jgi:aspartokinase
MKFGGASLGTSAGLAQVLGIIADESKSWERLVIDVSALEGVTDMLLDAAQFARIDNPNRY